MAKLNKIYKVDTRDQVACLTQLVGSQKRTLIDCLEGIKPAVLTTSVVSPASGYGDLGINFQVYKDRKYLMRIETAFSDTITDASMSLFVISSDMLNSATIYGYSIDGIGTVSLATDIDPGDNGIGLVFSPSSEQSVAQGYGSVYFECSDNSIVTLKFKDDSGDASILAGSCFTLTEIMNND